MRADAQRNYDRLVQEARQAFFVHGTGVALEDIARHAEVGIGTLYRHFPDRLALMSAVFELELDALVEHAHDLMDAEDAADALGRWLHATAVRTASYRGLSVAIMQASQHAGRMAACKSRLYTAGGALLARAQAAGTVRADATIGDLLKLTHAVVLVAEKNPGDRGLFERLLSLVLDGVHTRPGAQP
jgi:AcrR family transcriptional regulator